MAAAPNLADKGWITDQYDRYVLGNTVLAMPDDAGMLRLAEDSNRGIALAMDGSGRYTRLDPYHGAQLALAEAYRNVAAAGAQPVAVTDCLNFGSPEDPEVMWQFAEAVRGLADACYELGVPVTGGNVSFYNQTGATPINPTPVIGVLGLLDDVRCRRRIGFAADGDEVYLLGVTRDEFGGSEWAHVAHDHLGGRPPGVDLAAERALADVLVQTARSGLVNTAHDLSDGGLAQALVECCVRDGHGAQIRLPEGLDPFVALFAESVARAVVTVAAGDGAALQRLAGARGLACTRLGQVAGSQLEIAGLFAVDVDELRAVSCATLPELFEPRHD
jgi:phosphoribosylformylglycinamidine synthase